MTKVSRSLMAANCGLVVLSLTISMVLAEAGYRIYRAISDPLAPDKLTWWLTPTADGDFDAELGQKFTPQSTIHASIVRDGKVIGCLGNVYVTNSDGLSGETTYNHYMAADHKVVLTGNSFGRWRLGGLSIADILQQRLEAATGQRVAVLNLARGGYGLLQMISMAAVQTEELEPDLIVAAFITDDLTRGRWWTRPMTIDGRQRELLAAHPTDADDPERASDTSVIDARATREWCEERLRLGDRDAVLREANAFVESEIRRKNLRVSLFALDRVYVFDMLWRRLSGASHPSGFPRIDATRFAADPRYQTDRETLRRTGVRLLLLHLPVEGELAAGRPLLAGDSAKIWTMIERDFETTIATYFDLKHKPTVPAVHNLEPLDGHPNAAGIAFYGDVAFSTVLQRRLIRGLAGADQYNR